MVVTAAGLAKIEAELEELVNVRRPANLQRIRDAKSLGDLRENFDFHDAKRDQSFIEGRINALKEIIGRAHVVSDEDAVEGVVSIGCMVEMTNLATGTSSSYTIVGAAEAEPAKGKISKVSTMGKAVMGQSVGATVEIATPRGPQSYRIDAVRRSE